MPEVTGTPTMPPTTSPAPAAVGTLCWCERPGCTGTGGCWREFAATESGWRQIADRRPSWTLANGQAI